jgi:hypothetical protein
MMLARLVASLRGSDAEEKAMTITLDPVLEAALNEAARRQGVPPDVLAVNVLRERFLVRSPAIQPQDEWERRLLGLAINCGVSLSDEALSRESLYE